MKSFKQFLSEEEARQGKLLTNKGTAQDFRNPKKIPFTGTDPTPTPSSSGSPEAPKAPKSSPGQMEIPSGKTPTGTTTKVPGSKVRGAAADPWKQFPKKPQQQLGMPKTGPSSPVPGRTLAPAGGTTAKPALPAAGQTQKGAPLARRTGSNPGIPDAMLRGAQDAANKPPATPKPPASTPTKPSSVGKPPALSSTNARRASAEAKKAAAAAGTGSSGKTIVTPAPTGSSGASSGGKPPKLPEAPKVPGKFAKIGKFAGPASAALDTALSTADERSKGSGWARSLAKGATVAAGGLLGGTAGAIGGGGVLSAVTGTAGALAGGAAAEKAFDTAAGANAVQRKAIATANRKSQAGGAIKGIGGKTTFDTKKNTITSGGKTAQLGKTSVVTGPGGKQEVGNLAYKDGKAVYKRSDTKSLAQTSSNPLERIGRSLFAGAYKQSDAANAAKKLATARQSDAARNKALGVKFGPGK